MKFVLVVAKLGDEVILPEGWTLRLVFCFILVGVDDNIIPASWIFKSWEDYSCEGTGTACFVNLQYEENTSLESTLGATTRALLEV